jgi:Helix-turn-helix domain
MKTAPGGGGGLNDFQRPGKAGSHPDRNTTQTPAATTSPPGPRVTPAMNKIGYFKSLRGVKLPAGAIHVLTILYSYSDPDGGSIHPGVTRLAGDCDMGESTVKRHLKLLRHEGFLVLDSRGGRSGDGRTRASTYRLAIPNSQSLSSEPLSDSQSLTSDSQSLTSDVSKSQQWAPIKSLSSTKASSKRERALALPEGQGVLTAEAANIVPITRTRKTHIPANFHPSPAEWQQLAQEYPGVDLGTELKKFIHHHQGHGNLRPNWLASFRSWLDKVPTFSTRANGSSGGADGKCEDWDELGRQRTALREAEALAAEQSTRELEARKDTA